MPAIFPWLMLFSGGSFLIYGLSCLMSGHMREEFSRFGLARFRALVGWLEVAGGLGQLAFVLSPLLATSATGGLFILMLLGTITRIRIGDTLWVTLPALGYLMLNGWLLFTLVPR